MGKDHRVMGSERLKLVGRGDEGQAGDLGDLFGNLLGKADRRIEAGSDSGAALCQFVKARKRDLQALDGRGDLRGIAAEFLAKRQRRCILCVGAADLDDMRESLRLGVQGLVEVLERRDKVTHDLLGAGNVHGRRISVVRRLAHVDVVVGMYGLLGAHLAAQHLDCAIGNDFVGIHVRLGAGTGLPYDKREVIVQLAVDNFLGSSNDCVTDLRIKAADSHIGAGGCLLDDAERTHDGERLLFPADLEIAE